MTKLVYIIIGSILIFAISGCSSGSVYDIHKPKVRYKPSLRALDKLNSRAIGKPYIWGEERANRGFDCSGLTYYNYGSMGIEIPRVADAQFRSGTPVSRDELQKGDLVFFATNRHKPWKATHVGIYLGNGMFEHASSAKRRVVISSLDKPYYRNHYLGARRYHSFYQCQPQRSVIRYASNSTFRQNQISSYKNSNYYEPSNAFAQAQGDISANSSSKYYIILNSYNQDPNALVTKLELSGLRTELLGNNKVVVGPFNSKTEALETRARNIQLLANSEIRANI
jgi:hypothetical protein